MPINCGRASLAAHGVSFYGVLVAVLTLDTEITVEKAEVAISVLSSLALLHSEQH